MVKFEVRESLIQEKKKLQFTRDVVNKAWETEVKCYEQDLKQEITVQELNPRLFPYDRSCYFLLDMYMCVQENFPYVLPCYVDEMARRRDGFVLEESYLPSSAFAVWFSLVPKHRSPTYSNLVSAMMEGFKTNQIPLWISDSNHPLASDFTFLDEWIESLENEWANNRNNVIEKSDLDISHLNAHFKISTFESLKKGVRTKTLLKLLKHSMSELQRDHRLATAVLLALVEYECFDGVEGVEAFRYFLVTVESEFLPKCDETCLERDGEDLTHVCPDWQKFMTTFSMVLRCGIDFNQGHAEVLSTFVESLLHSAGWDVCDSLQDLVGWDPEDDDTVQSMELLLIVLRALVNRNNSERRKIFTFIRFKYMEESVRNISEEDLRASVSSHRFCTQAILDIGTSVLIRCPANPTTETIGSTVATGLLLATIDPSPRSSSSDFHDEGQYIGRHESLSSFIEASRYADAITYATTASQRRRDSFRKSCGIHHKHNINNDDVVQSLFLSPPSDEIQTVMKGLFLRQLVETHESCFGYGDFLAWTGLSISPYESMLYEPNMNYPDLNGYDFTDLHDEETDDVLSIQQIRARYDLSLLFLRRSWSMPWSPSSHLSFQEPFRQAVKTTALCSHRLGLPLELCLTVNSFLSREWWPDERAECWLYECLIDRLERRILGDESSDQPKSLIKCRGCMVACACSKKHLKGIFHEGHQRLCATPPLRVPTEEDLLFCSQYLEHTRGDLACCACTDKESTEESIAEEEIDSDDDENADWVSVGSSDDIVESTSKTEFVRNYFENNAYKFQKREEHAFATYYAD